MGRAPQPTTRASLTVCIVGRGKVGGALARALAQAGVRVSVRPGRRLGTERIEERLLVLAVSDGAVATVAERMARDGLIRRGRGAERQAVVHCAGALGLEALAAARAAGAAVGAMHPLHSFALDGARAPLGGAWLLFQGDAAARRLVARLARALDMHVLAARGVDRTLYHAAAALLAGGAVALMEAAVDVARRAGLPRARVAEAFAPLLGSVVFNLIAVGLPGALTGPVRRGDLATVKAHLDRLEEAAPSVAPLYRALVRAQLDLARAVGEARPSALARIRALAREGRPPRRLE
jgi:predicted short-subunit dehydrogenase-like oxidoreductase (DUF2520 family)